MQIHHGTSPGWKLDLRGAWGWIKGLKVESYLYTTHFRLLGPNSSRMKLKWNFVNLKEIDLCSTHGIWQRTILQYGVFLGEWDGCKVWVDSSTRLLGRGGFYIAAGASSGGWSHIRAPRSYKAFSLENGLRVLLVEDSSVDSLGRFGTSRGEWIINLHIQTNIDIQVYIYTPCVLYTRVYGNIFIIYIYIHIAFVGKDYIRIILHIM